MTDTLPESLPDEPDQLALDTKDRDLDALCEKWVYWCRTRRLYWQTSIDEATIAKGSGTRPLSPPGEEAIPSASLAAFHIAYTCQPNSLDKQVFDLYYLARVKPVKTAAGALGIGRAHFYRVLVEFRRRLASAAQAFEQNGASLHTQLPTVNSESVSQSGDNLDP